MRFCAVGPPSQNLTLYGHAQLFISKALLCRSSHLQSSQWVAPVLGPEVPVLLQGVGRARKATSSCLHALCLGAPGLTPTNMGIQAC